MTSALILPSFNKNSAAGAAGLVMALCCFFAAAPAAEASGLTEPQIQAVVDLLVAFDTEESAISDVMTILQAATTAPAEVSTEARPEAAALACPVPPAGAQNVVYQRAGDACSVSWLPPAQAPGIAAAGSSEQAPDVAGLMVAAAIAPWQAAVASFSQILYAVGVY